MIFNIGLRVDSYDANQKVLSDKYLLHQAYTVGESTDFLNTTDIPSTIGNGYVVYVDDASNPSAIVGYRDNETWYNADGLQISDPLLVAEAAGGQIQPYLVDPEGASAGEVKVDIKFLKTMNQKQYLCLELHSHSQFLMKHNSLLTMMF